MNYFNHMREYLDKKDSLQTFPVKEKAPFIKDWQSTVITDEIIDAWETEYIGYADGFGIKAGQHNIGFYDIDTDDPMIITKIDEYLDVPNICSKKGLKGKTVFFRYVDSLAITKKNFYLRKGDKKPVVEFFITVGQTVLPPSMHPETKMPYKWISESLIDIDIEELPVLDLNKLTHLQDVIQAPSLQEGIKNVPDSLGSGSGKYLTITREATRLLHLGVDDATIAKTLVTMDRILFPNNQFFTSGKVGADKRDTDIETAICWVTTYKSSLLRTDKDLRDIMMKEVKTKDAVEITGGWMPVTPLTSKTESLEFPDHLFPDAVRSYCMDLSKLSAMPPEAFLTAIFTTFTATCQAKVTIYAKRDFIVHPSVSTMIIAPSGSRKDTIFDWAREPLMKLVRSQLDKVDSNFIENEKMICDQIEETNKKKKQAIRDGDDQAAEEFKSKIIELQNSLMTYKKARPKFIFESGTQEMLYELMANNQDRGIFLCSSEYVHLIGGMNKKGNESLRGFYLKLLNGSTKETFSHQTKSGVNVDIRKVVGCALVGAQTDVLAKDIRAMESGDQSDGLLQRFFLVNVNPEIKRMDDSETDIDSSRIDNLYALYYNYEGKIDVTWLDNDAKNAYLDYDYNLRIKSQNERSAIKSFRSKFSGQSVKMAWIYEAMNAKAGVIPNKITKKSFLLAVEFLEWMSKNVDITWHNIGYSTSLRSAEVILMAIKSGLLANGLTSSSVANILKINSSDISSALELLESHNYLRMIGGKLEINPEI